VQLPPQIPELPRRIDAHGDAIQQRLHGHDRSISSGATTSTDSTAEGFCCGRDDRHDLGVALGLHGQSVH
jgi:hypothetical protein